MKITRQRLKEIIREEMYRNDDAMTGEERAVLAASKEFIQYLKSQGLSDMSHPTIKRHLIDLGLPPSVAGQYALFSAQTFQTPERMVDDEYEKLHGQEYDELEEGGYAGHATQSGGSSQSKEADTDDDTAHQWSSKGRKKTASKRRRAGGKQDIKKGDLDEAAPEGYPMTNKQKRAEIEAASSGEEEETLKLPKYDPETRKRFHRQQSQTRDLARHKRARGLKSKAGV